MTKQKSLLDKYYRGESSLEEEKKLKSMVLDEDNNSPEQDIFRYFNSEGTIPEGLEEDIFQSIEKQSKKGKSIRMKIYSAISAAAVVLVLLSLYLDFRSTQKTQMEDNFFVMEQALFQISESLQPPQEQEEMLVLWVDNDVEIIIN